jgi:hypothetical protein
MFLGLLKFSHLSNSSKHRENMKKCGSCPLRSKTKGFPRVFRISAKFLWPSVAPMQLGAWRLRRCISRRAAQIESFFESRESSKHWGFAWPRLAPLHARGRGRIRTIISISTHFTTHRELPSHARSPFRSCLHPVLVPLKWSFGILIS